MRSPFTLPHFEEFPPQDNTVLIGRDANNEGPNLLDINISFEDLAKKKLFIATPMYGGICAGIYTKSMCDLSAICTKYNIALQYFCLFNESLITRARNYCCDEFLRSEMDHFLFLDSDIGFDPNDVIAMLAIQTDESQYDLLGAPYPKKCLSWEKIIQAVNKGVADADPNVLDKYVGDFVFNPLPGKTEIPLGEPCEVLELGTGFMMMPRRTLLKFRENYSQYHYRPDHIRTAAFDGTREIMQFFQAEIDQYDVKGDYRRALDAIANGEVVDIEAVKKMLAGLDEKVQKSSKRYLSEDYWFTQRCREIGLKTWLLPWMKTIHMGSYMFGGSLIDLAQIGASPTADAALINKHKKKI